MSRQLCGIWLIFGRFYQEEFFLLRRQGHLRLPRPGMESVQAEAGAWSEDISKHDDFRLKK